MTISDDELRDFHRLAQRWRPGITLREARRVALTLLRAKRRRERCGPLQ